MPLTGNFCPWPRAVKPARFFVAGPAKKVQGLSNQYRHFKLFSISTGRNKPPGKISQSPRPRRPPQPPVTHTHRLCPGVSAPSPAPHPPPGPPGRSRILRSKHPGHLLSQYSWAQPSARRPPAARGGSVITEPRGARRPPARKHAAGPGTGKSGGEPQRPQPRHAPALEPPQAARLPPPPQPGARGLVAPQNIPQRKHCGPSPRRGARQRPVGVPSSRNLEAPDAHQRASTPQGRERGRAGANPSARNNATLPL